MTVLKRTIVILILTLTSHARGDRIDLSAIIAHPQKFDGREVTVTGLAADNANGLYVFPTFEAASKGARNTESATYVPYPHKEDYNRHWVEVSGVVHAGRHGWAGQNPCEIWMTHFRDLYPEKRALWPEDIGSFLNATSTSIVLETDVAGGAGTATVLNSYQTATVPIIPFGRLVVSHGAKVMFTAQLRYPKRRPKDPPERRFRFVIHEHRLDFVGKQ